MRLLLELDPRHELAISLAADVARVDEAEPTTEFSLRVSGDCGSRVGGRGHGQIEPVEDVEELRPDIELQLLLDGEAAAQTHVLRGLALPAIVVIETSGLPELSRRRVCPGGRVQYQVLSGVDAAATGVFQEQRLTGNPVHARALKEQLKEVVVR